MYIVCFFFFLFLFWPNFVSVGDVGVTRLYLFVFYLIKIIKIVKAKFYRFHRVAVVTRNSSHMIEAIMVTD